jgi:tape measure domain-containing protein
MAGIKAGTAYVKFEPAGLAALRSSVTSSVTSAGSTAGANASRAMARSMTGTAAAKKAYTDIVSGLTGVGRAVAVPIVSSLTSIMSSGAVSAARSFVTDFGRGISAVASGGSITAFLRSLGPLGASAGSAIASSLGRGLSSVPGLLSGVFTQGFAGARLAVSGFIGLIGTIPTFMASASKAVQNFGRTIGMASYQAQNLGLLLTAAFTVPVVGIAAAGAAIGIKFAVQVEDATVALKSLLPAGYNVAALIKRLQTLAIQSPVFDSAAVITFTQRMVAAGLEVSKVERFLKAFGNIAVTVGIPMDKMNFALEAFSQMAGKGVVNMEELRQQLGDALPGALKIAADGLGVTQAKLFEMVKAGDVTADQLLSAFIKVGESATYVNGAATGADTLRSRWNQLVETVQSNLANAVLKNMDSIKQSLSGIQPALDLLITSFGKNLPSAIDWVGKLVNGLNTLVEKYTTLSAKDRDLVKIFIGIAAIAGPAVLILGAFGTAIAGIAAGVSVLIGPVGLTIAAIIGVGLAAYAAYKWFVNLWNTSDSLRNAVQKISDAFTSYLLPTLTKIWNIIKSSFIDAWENLRREVLKNKDNFNDLISILQAIGIVVVGAIGLVIGVILGVAKAIGPLLTGIASFITGVIQIVVGVVSFFYDLINGNFEELNHDIRQIWNGLWDAIVGTVFNLGKAVWNLISGFVEGVVGFFEGMYDVLVGHSIVPDMINAIIRWFISLPGKVIGVIASFVGSIIAKFIEIAGSVISSVSGMVDRVSSFFSGLPGRILSAIGNLGSLLYSTGRNVVQGLINGISDMAERLFDKAKSIADRVKNTIDNAFKIGSPSRVMFETGRFITEGLILGITRDVADLNSAISRVASGAVSAVSNVSSTSVATPDASYRAPASLYIENYTAPSDASPSEQAEAWAWLNRSRGWS